MQTPIVFAAGAVALLAASGAHAANVNAPALPIDRVVTIQPYQVCNDAGTTCAPVTFLPQYLTVANALLNQAGIAVAAAPVVRLNAGQYLNATTTNTNFDNLRDLVRLPANAPATPLNAATLNVWFVNTLTNVANPTRPSSFYGFGLIGGNGAVLATGRDALGRTAAGDTLAHELAHNLGLLHPEDPPRKPVTEAASGLPYRSPRNLMQSVGRAVVDGTNLCAVPPYTCSTGTAALNSRGVLVREQVAALRAPPIFTQLPKVETGATLFAVGPPVPGVPDQVGTRAITDITAPLAGDLSGVEFRYKAASTTRADFVFVTPTGPTVLLPSRITNSPAPGGGINQTITVTLPAAANFPGQVSGSWVEPIVAAGVTFTPPYSSQYTFSNGITSRAGFDSTGRSGSDTGAAFGFDPATPGLPTGPSLLPQDIGLISPITGRAVEEIFDANWSSPRDLAAIPLPFDAFEPQAPLDFPGGITGVPVPGALLLFVPALLGLFAAARRPNRAARA